MKNILPAVLLTVCALSPALAQDPHSKVLIDSAANLSTADWKIGSAQWGGKTVWSVAFRTLHGGRQEGVQVIEVDNGALRFTIVPSRGFEVWTAQVGKLRLGWDAPVKEIVHPSYIRLTDNAGRGWVSGFGGLMVRGGLASFGSPVQDGQEQLTLHGRVDYLPAGFVSVRYEAAPVPRLVFRGVVDDVQTFGSQLRLTSEISTAIGSREFAFDDIITNLSDAPQEFQLLYHTNFGTPLLGAGSEFVAPVKQVAPMNPASAEGGLKDWNRYSGPHAAPYTPKVFNMQLHGDARGETKAMLRSSDGANGVLMRFDTKGLPYMSLWKNEITPKAGYVTGLEPGTGFPNPRPVERAAGRVPKLKGGESYHVRLAIAGLTGKEEVANAAREIQALAASPPVISQKPTGP